MTFAGSTTATKVLGFTKKSKGSELEWRIFFPLTASNKKMNIFQQLSSSTNGKFKANSTSNKSQRTDNYVVLAHDGYGLKFRHGKNLELKVRMEEYANIESWNKYRFSDYRMKDMNIVSLIDMLSMKKSTLDEDMRQCLQLLQNQCPSSFIVQCEKERMSGICNSLSMEQTQCTVEILDRYNINEDVEEEELQSILKYSEWMTISVEGKRKRANDILVVANEVQNILQNSKGNNNCSEESVGIIIGGYPRWLCNLCNTVSYKT